MIKDIEINNANFVKQISCKNLEIGDIFSFADQKPVFHFYLGGGRWFNNYDNKKEIQTFDQWALEYLKVNCYNGDVLFFTQID